MFGKGESGSTGSLIQNTYSFFRLSYSVRYPVQTYTMHATNTSYIFCNGIELYMYGSLTG